MPARGQVEKLLPDIIGGKDEDQDAIEAVMPNLPEALAKEFGHDGLGEYGPNHDYKGPIEVLSHSCVRGNGMCIRACARMRVHASGERAYVRVCGHAASDLLLPVTRKAVRYVRMDAEQKHHTCGPASASACRARERGQGHGFQRDVERTVAGLRWIAWGETNERLWAMTQWCEWQKAKDLDKQLALFQKKAAVPATPAAGAAGAAGAAAAPAAAAAPVKSGWFGKKTN